MSQPSQEPMTKTVTIPQSLANYWRSVQADRYELVARVMLTLLFATLVILPWLWGVMTITTDIISR